MDVFGKGEKGIMHAILQGDLSFLPHPNTPYSLIFSHGKNSTPNAAIHLLSKSTTPCLL